MRQTYHLKHPQDAIGEANIFITPSSSTDVQTVVQHVLNKMRHDKI